MPLVFWVAVLGVLGLLVGSFLNVVVHRVPAGLSIVAPGSACPGCAARGPRPRQRAGGVVAAAARPVPRLRCADLGALPARRGGHRRCSSSSSRSGSLRPASSRCSPPCLVVTAAGVALALIDLEHRPAAVLDHRRRGRARRARARAGLVGRRRRGVDGAGLRGVWLAVYGGIWLSTGRTRHGTRRRRPGATARRGPRGPRPRGRRWSVWPPASCSARSWAWCCWRPVGLSRGVRMPHGPFMLLGAALRPVRRRSAR